MLRHRPTSACDPAAAITPKVIDLMIVKKQEVIAVTIHGDHRGSSA
nr:hypothetical protein [Sphingomonas laterariae]